MADLERTIEILFQGRDDISAVISRISRNVDAFGSDLQDIGQPFADAVEKVALFEAAVIAISTAVLKARSDIETSALKMKNALALPTEEAEEFEKVARRVYTSAIADDMVEAFDLVTQASMKFKDSSVTDIEEIVTTSKKLSNTFDVDYSDVLTGAASLTNDFKVSSTDAFDFIAKGLRDGLNDSDDFIDSITEYGSKFADSEADIGEFFSILQTGFTEGIGGTDLAADAFKEFVNRIQDDSKSTKEALETIGIDNDQLQSDLNDGTTSLTEAFTLIITGLQNVDDKGELARAGVALLGTRFEDLGTTAALSLSTTETDLEDLKGTIDSIDPNVSLGKKFEQLMHTISDAFVNADEWSDIENRVAEVVDDIKTSFTEAFEDTDLSPLFDSFDDLMDAIAELFVDLDLDLTTIEGMENAIDLVAGSIETLNTVAGGVIDAFVPLLTSGQKVVDLFNDMNPETKKLVGNMLGLGAQLVIVGGAVKVGGMLLGGLKAFSIAVSGLLLVLSGPAGLVIGLTALATAVATFSWSQSAADHEAELKRLDDHKKKLDELLVQLDGVPLSKTSEVFLLIEADELDAAQELINEIVEEEKIAKIKAEVESQELDDLQADLDGIPEEMRTEYQLAIEEGNWDKVFAMKAELTGTENILVGVEVDSDQYEKAKEEIVWFDEDGKRHSIEVDVDTSDVDKAKKDIEEIPTEKMLEIKLQGDIDTQIAKITAQAATVQTAMEWTAKADIAEAEAAAQRVDAAFEASGEVVSSLSESVTDMFSSLSTNMSDLDTSDKWYMQDIMEDQMAMEQAAIDSQIKLTDAQIDYMKARTESLEGGDALIKIDSSGLEPALEMVMWEIIEKVQVRASAESADFLLGI